MPKIPSVKITKLLKILLKLGFFKHHQTGSHLQLKHYRWQKGDSTYPQGKRY
ncbi:MAG: type II toxin-antitoxin system HicA family toxin [Patescibacteria group bacterium]